MSLNAKKVSGSVWSVVELIKTLVAIILKTFSSPQVCYHAIIIYPWPLGSPFQTDVVGRFDKLKRQIAFQGKNETLKFLFFSPLFLIATQLLPPENFHNYPRDTK